MIVYTENGTALTLKEPELGKGGEGSVYAVANYPNRVVKVFKKNEAAQRKEKILEMISIARQPNSSASKLTDFVTWPMGAVFDKNANFIGYGMQTIHSSIELDDVYCYPPQGNENLSISDRVDVLIDLCRSINLLHSAGQVFADGNPNNIKIISHNKVKMIDADSYQIKSRGKEYRCIVCHPEYVAPELSRKIKNGKTYETVPKNEETFTKETDRYSLAIHIFKMLMNGAHPFNYRDTHKVQSSKRTPKKSLSERVENGESVYFKNISGKTAPAFAPDICSFPQYMIDLFTRAFITGASSPASRPTAREWENALIRYKSELKSCSKNRLHYYHKSSNKCPYCKADENYISSKLRKGNTYNQVVNKPEKTSHTTRVLSPAMSSSAYSSVNVNSYANTSQASCVTVNNKTSYWIISMLLSIALNVILGCSVLNAIYHSVTDNSIISTIGVIGSIIAGVIATILYNCFLSSAVRNNTNQYCWYDYILSILSSLGGIIALGLLLLIIVCIVYIVYYILVFAIIIVIIGVLLGG